METQEPKGRPERIRVLVVDDDEVVRRGLGAFLSICEDMDCVGEADNGADAIHLCAELVPDVVLMDLVMPRMDGFSATRVIRRSCPETQVLALTSVENQALVREALAAGAIGCVMKNTTAAELAEAIRAAGTGQGTLSPI